jgi:scyllo-inosose 3-dehydrogenase
VIGIELHADWEPRNGYVATGAEQLSRRVNKGSMVWRNPQIRPAVVPDPAPGEHQVVIEIAACGICGSDMHMYECDAEGYMLYPGLTRFPNVIGHEFSGRVVESGSAVRSVRLGDLVTAEEMQWCGRCRSCRRGLFNACDNLEELGFTVPGAMAQYVAVDEKYCWKLADIAERTGSEREALQLGALVEPLSVAYNAVFVRNQHHQPGNYCLVQGAGPIGLASVALALAAGCALVVAVEPAVGRRRVAKELGAHYVLEPADDLDENLLHLTRGQGFDIVVEAAGAPTLTLTPLERCLSPNAAICHIGRSNGLTPLNLEAYQRRSAQVYAAQGHAGNGIFPSVIRLLASGQLIAGPMINELFSLEDAPIAFRRLRSRQDAKLMLHVNL